MNKRLLSVLAFALVISAVASWVLYRLIVTKLAASAKPAIAQVVVASRNLEIGTLVKDSDVKLVDWNGPEPKGALGTNTDVIGRGVVATIYEDWFRVDTYYREDTRNLYMQLLPQFIEELAAETCAAKGFKLEPHMKPQPPVSDLTKRPPPEKKSPTT